MEKKEDKLKWEDVESAIDNLCKEDLKIWISDLLYLPEELDKAREEEYKKLIEIFSNLKKEDLVNKGFILSLIKEELSKVEKYPQKAVYLSAEEVERREKVSKLKDNK